MGQTKVSTKIRAGMAVALLLGGSLAQAVEVQLKPLCVCRGPIVRLGDVAVIRTVEARLADELAELELFPAPAVGKTRFVRASEVRQRLRSLSRGPAIEVTGAQDLRIRAPLPSEQINLASAAVKPSAAQPENAQKKVEIRVVARRPLKRGDRISRYDVALEPGEVSQHEPLIMRHLDTAIGMEVVRSLEAGNPVTTADIRPPILVKPRDVVTVRALAAGVRITTQAQAIDAGAEGDVVFVESLDSKQRYTARVSGLREVEVYARGPSVPGETPSRDGVHEKRTLADRERFSSPANDRDRRTAWKGRRTDSAPESAPHASQLSPRSSAPPGSRYEVADEDGTVLD